MEKVILTSNGDFRDPVGRQLKGYGRFFDELCLLMTGFCFGTPTSAGIQYVGPGICLASYTENIYT